MPASEITWNKNTLSDVDLANSPLELIKQAYKLCVKTEAVAATFFKCSSCVRSFTSEKRLANHTKIAHDDHASHSLKVCSACNPRFLRSHRCKKLPNPQNSQIFNFSDSFFEESPPFSNPNLDLNGFNFSKDDLVLDWEQKLDLFAESNAKNFKLLHLNIYFIFCKIHFISQILNKC